MSARSRPQSAPAAASQLSPSPAPSPAPFCPRRCVFESRAVTAVKRARGAACRHLIEHAAEAPDALRAFEAEGFRFAPAKSDDETLVFARDDAPS